MPKRTPEIDILRIYQDIREADSIFAERYITGDEAAAFVRGEQWTPEEKAAHLAQRRIPFVFNEILPKVRHLMGVYLATITDVRPVPREPADEYYVNAAEQLLRWFEQINNLSAIEYQVFWDMIVRGIGATQIRWVPTDVLGGYPALERIPPGQLLWDPRAMDISLSDARWMCRVIPIDRLGALELYPEYKEAVERAARFPSALIYRQWLPELVKMYPARTTTPDRDLVVIVEHYEKLRVPVWIVVDEVSGNTTEFDSEREAREYREGLLGGYLAEGNWQAVLGEEPEDVLQPPVVIVQQQRVSVWQSIIIGDQLVHHSETELPDFPYQVGFGFFDNGRFWGYVEQLMDPQRFFNRMISQWDNILGRSQKQLATVVEEMLKPGWTAADVARERSKTAPVIPVLSHEAIQFHPNQGAIPDFAALAQLMLARLVDYAGGPNVLGQQISAAESGMAVRERAQLGGLGQLPLFENLRQWRRKVSYFALWMMQNYLSPGMTLRVINSPTETVFFKLRKDTLDTIREIQFDIEVESTVHSTTIYEREFQLLSQYFTAVAAAIPPVVAATYLLELLPIPRQRKEELKKMIEFYVEYEAQKQREERKAVLVRQALESAFRRSIRRKAIEEIESQQQGNGVPNFEVQ